MPLRVLNSACCHPLLFLLLLLFPTVASRQNTLLSETDCLLLFSHAADRIRIGLAYDPQRGECNNTTCMLPELRVVQPPDGSILSASAAASFIATFVVLPQTGRRQRLSSSPNSINPPPSHCGGTAAPGRLLVSVDDGSERWLEPGDISYSVERGAAVISIVVHATAVGSHFLSLLLAQDGEQLPLTPRQRRDPNRVDVATFSFEVLSEPSSLVVPPPSAFETAGGNADDSISFAEPRRTRAIRVLHVIDVGEMDGYKQSVLRLLQHMGEEKFYPGHYRQSVVDLRCVADHTPDPSSFRAAFEQRFPPPRSSSRGTCTTGCEEPRNGTTHAPPSPTPQLSPAPLLPPLSPPRLHLLCLLPGRGGYTSLDDFRRDLAVDNLAKAQHLSDLPDGLCRVFAELISILRDTDILYTTNGAAGVDDWIIELARIVRVPVRLVDLGPRGPNVVPAAQSVTAFVAPSHFTKLHPMVVQTGVPTFVVQPLVETTASSARVRGEEGDEAAYCRGLAIADPGT